jgi:hypothetical protein
MLGNNFSLLFYLKMPKNYKQGAMPIYLRITVDGVVKEICTSRQCEPKLWSKKGEKATGKTEECRELNHYLSTLRIKVFARLRVRCQALQDGCLPHLTGVCLVHEKQKRPAD